MSHISSAGGGGSTAKTTVWEAGHREPTFVFWPGHVPAGRVSDSLLSALDIYPTIASIAGIHMPKYRSYDGMDISHVLYGKSLYNRVRFIDQIIVVNFLAIFWKVK